MKPLVYSTVNEVVLANVPAWAKSVLDVGCGDGSFGAALQASRAHLHIDGITFSASEAGIAQGRLQRVFQADLNVFDFSTLGKQYDCIVCSHVLEHLYHPEDVIRKLAAILQPGGHLIIALPNVLFFKQRWQFLLGRFRYSETGGLMDITHYRFYDWVSCEGLIQASNLKLVSKKASGMFPQPLIRSVIPTMARKMDGIMVNMFPGLFGFQFLIVASK